jgi:hypothetical protein
MRSLSLFNGEAAVAALDRHVTVGLTVKGSGQSDRPSRTTIIPGGSEVATDLGDPAGLGSLPQQVPSSRKIRPRESIELKEVRESTLRHETLLVE